MSQRVGQYIEIDWYGDTPCEIVMGWPGEAATRAAVERFAGNDWSRSWAFRECYAANLQTALCRAEGWQYDLRLYDSPGRGRYKVSVLEATGKGDE